MKRSTLAMLLGCLLVFSDGCSGVGGNHPAAPTETPPAVPTATEVPPATPTPGLPEAIRQDPSAQNWHLVFQDEFDGRVLDPNKWNTGLRWGPVNPPELQYYAPDSVQVANGNLRITADKRSMGKMDYTSGAVATFWHFWFTFGYVEMRARIPAGQGLWPAFWLLAHDPHSGNEIDVMEIRGQEPQVVHATLHYGPDRNADEFDTDYNGPDFSQGFHTFGVRWEPTAITWYVDGIEIFKVTEHVPQEPMDLIVNLAVGGVWPGNPDASTPFPANMDVDYVRVFKHS